MQGNCSITESIECVAPRRFLVSRSVPTAWMTRTDLLLNASIGQQPEDSLRFLDVYFPFEIY